MVTRLSLSRREVILILLGASLTRVWISSSAGAPAAPVFIENLHTENPHTDTVTVTEVTTKTLTVSPLPTPTPAILIDPLPATSLVAHAPGSTLFKDLYMSDGALFIVSDNPFDFPEIRMMTSTGLAAENTPQNIAAREPTSRNMVIITTAQARSRWAGNGTPDNRIFTVNGNTVLVNEPSQFLRHFYHFVGELFFGIQVFWHGAFYRNSAPSSSIPPIHRVMFSHSNADGWHDAPGSNPYFLQAAFPSAHVEVQEDWDDRVALTAHGNRVWHFPLLLLSDRSAAHRGKVCGSQTQRIASEAWKHMQAARQLVGIRGAEWWEPVRTSVLRFAGAPAVSSDDVSAQAALARLSGLEPETPKKVVISYISRQAMTRRRLADESHAGLVTALSELVKRKGESWELNILAAETMTKEEQLMIAGRTDFLWAFMVMGSLILS
ncbi:hypothetical protein FB451DRAFT_434591 [Mycena latifolia]|nr:hypothetical protein FB451DRAFT_434591 [Mycena latifolia]